MSDAPVVAFVGDMHDRDDCLKAIHGELLNWNVQAVVLLGDVNSGESVLTFEDYNVHAVYGNNDDSFEYAAALDQIGARLYGESGLVTFGRKEFCIRHGLEPRDISYAIAGTHADYVVHGHYHSVEDTDVGSGKVLSPGDAGILFYHVDSDSFEQVTFENVSNNRRP